MNKRERIYSTEGTNQTPLALSVDWLNNKLYILFESVSMVRESNHSFLGEVFFLIYFRNFSFTESERTESERMANISM